MNKAFTKGDDDLGPAVVPPRAPLPDGVPNYVTPRGLRLLRSELESLEEERRRAERDAPDEAARRRAAAPFAQRVAELADRLASAVVVDPSRTDASRVRFGTAVTVVDGQGARHRHAIVGVDEADPATGRIAFTSPIARALIGREEGDVATVSTPRGEETLEIVAIEVVEG